MKTSILKTKRLERAYQIITDLVLTIFTIMQAIRLQVGSLLPSLHFENSLNLTNQSLIIGKGSSRKRNDRSGTISESQNDDSSRSPSVRVSYIQRQSIANNSKSKLKTPLESVSSQSLEESDDEDAMSDTSENSDKGRSSISVKDIPVLLPAGCGFLPRNTTKAKSKKFAYDRT